LYSIGDESGEDDELGGLSDRGGYPRTGDHLIITIIIYYYYYYYYYYCYYDYYLL